MTFKFILFLLVLLAQSLSRADGPSCRSLFREPLVGYFRQTGQNKQSISFVNTDPKDADSLKKQVGTIDFDYFDGTDAVLIEWMHVDDQFQDRGLSTHMIQEVLNYYPDTAKVVGYLTNKNLQSYLETLGATGSSEKALKATPYYRSLKQLGYTEVIHSEHHDDKVIVTLQKPSPVH